VSQFLAVKCIFAMDLAPYSPHLAPADFWLFPELKNVLKRKCFSDFKDIKFVKDFKNCFVQSQKRWEYCKELEGDYLEKILGC
jgi:hypothetical protein